MFEDALASSSAAPPDPEASAKRARKASRKSVTAADEVKCTRARKWTVAERYDAVRRGVCCSICLNLDASPDPVEIGRQRLWGNVRIKDKSAIVMILITDGRDCWYCIRTFQAKYYTRFLTLNKYRDQLGLSRELHEEVQLYTAYLIQIIVDHLAAGGDRENLGNITWPSPKELQKKQIYELAWVLPEDEFVELSHYKHGDPAKNGRGDVLAKGPGGVQLVKVKTDRVWKRTRRLIQQVELKEKMNDPGDDLYQGCIQENFKNIADGISQSSSILSQLETQPVSTDLDSTPRPMMRPAVSEISPACSSHQSDTSPGQVDGPVHNAKQKVGAKAKERMVIPKIAKPKASGAPMGEGPSANTKSRGRPPKDNFTMLKQGLAEYMQSSDNTKKFFGPEWKNVHRNWNLYGKGLDGMIEAEESIELLDEMEIVRKQAASVKKVQTVVTTKGLSSALTLVAYREELTWISRPPVVANPFPPFFQALMIGLLAVDTWPAADFWKIIVVDDVATDSRIQYASEKVIVLVAESKDTKEAVVRLRELVDAYDGPEGDDLSTEVFGLEVVAHAPDVPRNLPLAQRITFVESTLKKFPDTKLGAALLSSGRGSSVYDRATSMLTAATATVMKQKDAQQLWTSARFTPSRLRSLEDFIGTEGDSLKLCKIVPEKEFEELIDASIDAVLVRGFGVLAVPLEWDTCLDNLKAIHACPRLLAVHGDRFEAHAKVIERVIFLAELQSRFDALDAKSSISEAHATKICVDIADASENSRCLIDLVGDGSAGRVLEYFRKAMGTEKGVACQAVATQSAAPVCEAAKKFCSDALKGTLELDFACKDEMEKAAEFELGVSVVDAIRTLRGMGHLCPLSWAEGYQQADPHPPSESKFWPGGPEF